MSKYEMIVEALQDMVDNGELTLENANAVNDLAYEKYVTEGFLSEVGAELGVILGCYAVFLIPYFIHCKIDNVKCKKTKEKLIANPDEICKAFEKKNSDIKKYSELEIETMSAKSFIKKIETADPGTASNIKHALIDYPNESTLEVWSYNKKPVICFTYEKKDKDALHFNSPSFSRFCRNLSYDEILYYSIHFVKKLVGEKEIGKYVSENDLRIIRKWMK